LATGKTAVIGDWRLATDGTDFDWRAHLPICRNFSAVREHCPPEKLLSTYCRPRWWKAKIKCG